MAQPFPRAWDILKQGPYDQPLRPKFTHEEVMARNAALPPIGQMGTPQEYGAVEMPQQGGMMPSLPPMGQGDFSVPNFQFQPPMGTYEMTQPMGMQQPAMGDEAQNRINALRAQIAALQQELQVLVSMQGPQHPQYR